MDRSTEIPTSKRIFDLVATTTALLLLAPILLLVALLIKLESKGPVFFVSKRVGQGFRIFDLYKFRTMETGAEKKVKDLMGQNLYSQDEADEPVVVTCNCVSEADCTNQLTYDGGIICEKLYQAQLRKEEGGVFFKVKDDPRITRLGHFLRMSSIDEIPQLINVLKGDMSLVGNRPLPLYEAEKLTTDGSVERFMAPAGLTGLWQVTKRGKKDMSPEERIALDNEYSRTYSFFTDLKLIMKTFRALMQTENV